MKISKMIGIGAAMAAGVTATAVLLDKFRKKWYVEALDNCEISRIIGPLNDTIAYDDKVMAIAGEEHKRYSEIRKKYDQLCKDYNELQNEYNEMLGYYGEDDE